MLADHRHVGDTIAQGNVRSCVGYGTEQQLGHALRRAVSEPLIPAPDQNFALGYTHIIDATLTPKRDRNRMLLRVGLVTILQIFRLDGDGDFLALGHFDDM